MVTDSSLDPAGDFGNTWDVFLLEPFGWLEVFTRWIFYYCEALLVFPRGWLFGQRVVIPTQRHLIRVYVVCT